MGSFCRKGSACARERSELAASVTAAAVHCSGATAALHQEVWWILIRGLCPGPLAVTKRRVWDCSFSVPQVPSLYDTAFLLNLKLILSTFQSRSIIYSYKPHTSISSPRYLVEISSRNCFACDWGWSSVAHKKRNKKNYCYVSKKYSGICLSYWVQYAPA